MPHPPPTRNCLLKLCGAPFEPDRARAMPPHDWEQPAGAAPPTWQAAATSSRSWEEPLGEHLPLGPGWDDGQTAPDCDPGDDDQPNTPGEELVQYCNSLYLSRKLSAKDMCCIMFFASRAGVQEASRYACNPSAPSGHFQRLLSRRMPYLLDRDILYELEVPSYSSDTLSRGAHTMTVISPHEAFAEAAGKDPSLQDRLLETVQRGDLPECYMQHPVAQQSGYTAIPLSIFIDGVPYSKNDGVIGFWLANELTSSRYLLAAARKRILCECGCRGWCSMYRLFVWLRWSLECLAAGTFPTSRHDGEPWRASDEARANRGGQPLGVQGCVIFLKGDWAEMTTTMGFPAWSSSMRPCFLCNATPARMYVTEGINPGSLPWRSNASGEYSSACGRCEHWVVLTPDTHAKVARLLFYDKRKEGSRGRALRENVPELGLVAGDRLEPSVGLQDVAAFEAISSFPAVVLFWRQSAETLARHRNPIFDEALGLAPEKTLCIDILHALNLGVFSNFCHCALWALVNNGAWGRRACADETVAAAALAIRNELKVFYRAWALEHPTSPLTRIAFFFAKDHGGPIFLQPADQRCRNMGFSPFFGGMPQQASSVSGAPGQSHVAGSPRSHRDGELLVRRRPMHEARDCTDGLRPLEHLPSGDPGDGVGDSKAPHRGAFAREVDILGQSPAPCGMARRGIK